MTIDVARDAWQLVLQGEEVPRTSTFFGSALKKESFSALFAALFAAFFGGSSSFSSFSKSQLDSIAAVLRSCRRFCMRWVNADSRRAADGFRIYLATIDLKGSESEFAVHFAEMEQMSNWCLFTLELTYFQRIYLLAVGIIFQIIWLTIITSWDKYSRCDCCSCFL